MDESSRIDWCRKQQTLALGSKRKFDEVEYSEDGKKSVGQENCEQDHFTPWWLFLQDGLRVGKTATDVEASWQNEVDKPVSQAINVRGEW